MRRHGKAKARMGLQIAEALKKVLPPQPMEIWIIKDSEIRMNDENKKDKHGRPCLIVQSNVVRGSNMISVIPLSRQNIKEKDTLIFPVERGYEWKKDDFDPDNNSCAIIPLYQPIDLSHFHERVGKLDAICYNAILNSLCYDYIGLDWQYDLVP